MNQRFIKHIAILFCITMFMLNNAQAQMTFDGGANLGLVDYLGDNAPDHAFHPGLGIRGQLCINEKNSVVLGFQYNLGSSKSVPQVVPSIAQDTTGSFLGVPPSPASYTTATEVFKSHLWAINVRVLHDFFGTTNTEGFGFYGYFGIGIVHEGVSGSLSPAPDPTIYNTTGFQNSSASTTGVTIDFGIGVDIPVSNFFIFGETGLAIPANSANGEEIDQSIPGMYEIKAGIRYPFGGDK